MTVNNEEVRARTIQYLKRFPDQHLSLDGMERAVAQHSGLDGHVPQDALRQVVWDLLTEGILYPCRDPNYADGTPRLDEFRVSERGKAYLRDGHLFIHDLGGYLGTVEKLSGQFSQTILEYMAEGVHAFQRGMYLASVVMIGAAIEAALLEMIDAFLRSTRCSDERRSDFQRKVGEKAIRAKLTWFMESVKSERFKDRDVADWLEEVLSGVGVLMSTRNAAGHPERRNPNRSDAQASLHLFASCLPKVYGLKRHYHDMAEE